MKKILNKGICSKFYRAVSALTAAAFLTQNFLAPVPAWGQSAEPAESASTATAGFMRIPEAMGSVLDRYDAGEGRPRVILIQDAHAVPEAQRNIQKLIGHFQTEYGVSLIVLEGASRPLDPSIFKSFPDPKILQSVLDEYLERGELTGGNAAAILNQSEAFYEGIEDWGLYEEGLALYQKALRQEAGLREWLNREKEDLRLRKEKIYSKGLLEIDRLIEDFYRNEAELLTVLEKLAKVREPGKRTELYPLLIECRRPSELEQPVDAEIKAVASEVNRFLDANLVRPAVREKQPLFNAKYQEFQTGRISPPAFALFMAGFVSEFEMPVTMSSALSWLMTHQQRMQDIKSTVLFTQFERYAEQVKTSLFKRGEEKILNDLSLKLRLLERWVALELTCRDWRKIRKMMAADPSGPGIEGVSGWSLFGPHLDFYRNTEARDRAFWLNLKRLLTEKRVGSAVFVAGGFHTEGMVRQFRRDKVSYLLVSPRVQSLPETIRYREHVEGNLSWKNYYKVENGRVSLYKAFVRAARDRLLKAVSSEDWAPILKNWRDQTIRDAARRGHLENVSEYTAFLDEIIPNTAAEEIRDKWLRNIDRFIEGVRGLQSQGQLTENNILGLIRPATILGMEGAVLAKHDTLASGALPGAAEPVRRESGRVRSELRVDLLDVVPPYDAEKAIGFFPGLGSRDAYKNLGSGLYDSGNPAVKRVYVEAAKALGYVTAEGEPDPSKLFFVDENMPEDAAEKGGFIAAAFLVHNLALNEQMKHAFPRLEITAYSGESLGILTAAVASGAMSVGDAVKFARKFTPCLLSCPLEEDFYVVGIQAEDLASLARVLRNQLGTAFEVHKYFSAGPNPQINVYIARSAYENFRRIMHRLFPQATYEELKPPTKFIAHSEKMARAREILDQFIEDERIEFHDAAVPIIPNNGGQDPITSAVDVARAVLGIVDEPMDSRGTVQMIDNYSDADYVVEIGRGGKSRPLMERNRVRKLFAEFTSEQDLDLQWVLLFSGLLKTTFNILRTADSEAKLEQHPAYYAMLRSLFGMSAKDPLMQKQLFNIISEVTHLEVLHGPRKNPPIFYEFLSVLQNTYLLHHVLQIKTFAPETLVLSVVFQKRIFSGKEGADRKIDVQMIVLDEDNEKMALTLTEYKYPESVVFAFKRLPLRGADLALRARHLFETQPLAKRIYEELCLKLNFSQDYFFSAAEFPFSPEQWDIRNMVYQYVLFKLTQAHRPAILGQNFYYVTGLDPLGTLAALAAGESVTIDSAVRYVFEQSRLLEKTGEAWAGLPVKEARIRILDPETGRQLKTAGELTDYLNDKLSVYPAGRGLSGTKTYMELQDGLLDQIEKKAGLEVRDYVRRMIESSPWESLEPPLPEYLLPPGMIPITGSYAEAQVPVFHLKLNFPSWIISFDPKRRTLPAEGDTDSEIISIGDIYDVWMHNVNPKLDILEVLSILRLTDQNGIVYRFAEGRGTTTANVYPYINVGERVIGFGTGGSESLTIFVMKPGDHHVTVRKVLSERLVTAHWDREGQGVMLPPFAKALAQVNYLRGLPEEAMPYFPEVYEFEERELPIPPDSPFRDAYHGVFRELVYDMSFIPGIEVSDFVRKHHPSPEIVAQLYKEIFRVLRRKIHVHRRAPPSVPTLEESYFTKIEKRLALSRKTAPQTFSSQLLDSEYIDINGTRYLNIGPLLQRFREHPEYLDVLEPRFHSLVMGDTNTENIKITDPGPILAAMERGDTNFTAEEIGLKFLDPRSIGFKTEGGDTVDDPMYDNKPWHNSLSVGRDARGVEAMAYDAIHGEYFDLSVTETGDVPSIEVTFDSDAPYRRSYTGIGGKFKEVMTAAWGLDDPDSDFLKDDPYWLVRFAFMMGTHFTAMPPFHFKTDVNGELTDDFRHQKRPVAIYAEGIKWLNLALGMLEGKVKEFHGVKVPLLPYQEGQRLLPFMKDFPGARSQPGAARQELRSAPETLASLGNEARLFFSPWMRVVRGTAVGQHPMDYDPKLEGHIRTGLQELDTVVPPSGTHHAFNLFAQRLTGLILDINNPDALVLPVVTEIRANEIMDALEGIRDPYMRVDAISLLFTVFAKLNLESSVLRKRDLVRMGLEALSAIPFEEAKGKGAYERLIVNASLFLAIGQLGWQEELIKDRDFVREALEMIDQVPSAYYRGRGASTLFSVLDVLGYGDRVVKTYGKDYMKETLDYLDEKLDQAHEIEPNLEKIFDNT